MAKNTLFPVIDVPTITATKAAEERKYKRSLFFDFEEGDFVRDGANKIVEAGGKEAYAQWCRKVVQTERFSCLAYSDDVGAEMDGALSQGDRAATESAIERTINEAIMINPKTEYVREFEFSRKDDTLYCYFTVKGQGWEEIRMGIPIST